MSKYLVYGGNCYAVPTIADSTPNVDLFEDPHSALQEFRLRKEAGRSSAGDWCPTWDSEGTGGVLVVSDDDAETLDLLR